MLRQLLALFVGAVITSILLWRAVFNYLRLHLRQLPAGSYKIIDLAIDNSAPIPQKFVKPQIRRQLLLRSKSPATYTNLIPLAPEGVTRDSLRATPRNRLIGFFHPAAIAGGGGERVLWAAVKNVLQTPQNVAVIYVAKSSTTPKAMVEAANQKFNLQFSFEETNRIVVIYLTQAYLIDPGLYPVLTLVGQALGSMVLAYEAISNLMPDVWVDTVGLAFSYPVVAKFAHIPIVSYTHYPFIQDDMLDTLAWWSPKRVYWNILLWAYHWASRFSTVPMANGTWTTSHLKKFDDRVVTVFPPCSTQSFGEPDPDRTAAIVCLAQFRPEKRQELLIKAFAQMRDAGRKAMGGRAPHLILIGGVRNEADKLRVKELEELAKQQGLTEKNYTIVVDAPWANVQQILAKSLVGVNCMWNEHFGMGVVEYMAAGLIPVVHASGGPLLDIVKDEQGTPGFFFNSKRDPDFARIEKYVPLKDALLAALELSPEQKRQYSLRDYAIAQKFSDKAFTEKWNDVFKKVYPHIADALVWRKKSGLYD